MNLLDTVVGRPPAAGHRLTTVTLGGVTSVDLREAYERSGAVAAHLLALGVGSGDRVGIRAANSLEWILLDLAALRIKAVTAGFDPGKFTGSGAELVRHYDLDVLFTDQACEGEAVRSISELAGLRQSVDLPPVRWAPNEATTLKFTSGSTGPAKALAASAGSIDNTITAVQDMFGHGEEDDLLVFLPLSLLQQRFWVYSALVFGHDVTITTYEAAFAALRRTRPTVVMGVPGFYETARAHIEAKAARTGGDPRAVAEAVFGGRIRYLWTGSAPARQTTLAYFTELGLPIFEGYGLNETCVVTKNHPGAHRPGSVGQVLPGKEVFLDGAGVIHVRSTHPVADRYTYAQPGDSARLFVAPGTVRTGDLGHLDEDGFLYVHGRADDVIVLPNGKKIVVRPIEERLRDCPAIDECVLACPHGTELVAVVSPATDPPDTEAITAWLAGTNAALGHDEQVRRIVLAERFSIDNGLLGAQFKPRRKEILTRYEREIAGWPTAKESNHA